jgi:hypothetical protein
MPQVRMIDRKRAAETLDPRWYRNSQTVLWVLGDLMGPPEPYAHKVIAKADTLAARESGWFRVASRVKRRLGVR